MEKWSKTFNIPLPECNKCGVCCICASPSDLFSNLIEKAATGDEFARDFFSIFVPYKDNEELKKLYSEIVERSIIARKKTLQNSEEPVFYRCMYYSDEKKCLIYEDRPSLCRDFPGSPYVILGKQCAYYNWSLECRQKYKELKEELENLKKCQNELKNFKYQQKAIKLNHKLKQIPEEYKLMWLCPSISLVSPGKSWIKIY